MPESLKEFIPTPVCASFDGLCFDCFSDAAFVLQKRTREENSVEFDRDILLCAGQTLFFECRPVVAFLTAESLARLFPFAKMQTGKVLKTSALYLFNRSGFSRSFRKAALVASPRIEISGTALRLGTMRFQILDARPCTGTFAESAPSPSAQAPKILAAPKFSWKGKNFSSRGEIRIEVRTQVETLRNLKGEEVCLRLKNAATRVSLSPARDALDGVRAAQRGAALGARAADLRLACGRGGFAFTLHGALPLGFSAAPGAGFLNAPELIFESRRGFFPVRRPLFSFE